MSRIAHRLGWLGTALIFVISLLLGVSAAPTLVEANPHYGVANAPLITAFVPPSDGACDTSSPTAFAPAEQVPLEQGHGGHVTAWIERTTTNLYICFTGIDAHVQGNPPNTVDDSAQVSIDSGYDAGVPTTDDFQIWAAPTSSATISAGGDTGGPCILVNCFTGPNPSGWTAAGQDVLIAEFTVDWRVEFVIPLTLLGGKPVVGLDMWTSSPSSHFEQWPAYEIGGTVSDPSTWGDLNLVPPFYNPGLGLGCVQDHGYDSNHDGYSDSDEASPIGAPTCTGAFPASGGLGLTGLSSSSIEASCPGRLYMEFGGTVLQDIAARKAQADVSLNGKVDLADLIIMAGQYNKLVTGPTDMRADLDLNRNGKVDLADLIIAASLYRQLVPPC